MVKFSSKPISEHAEVPLADEGRLETIVEHWQARARSPVAGGADGNAGYVVSVGPLRDPRVRAAQLAEIVSLVRSQGDRVVGEEICYLTEPNPRTLLGKGTAEALAARARAHGATMLVLDAELSPSQTRNLEDAAGIPVADREAVILNVFLRHARTRRARIQIEASGRTQRQQRGACKRMVLVGYTNAGKTSLMNALTGAGLSARDVPFETLDTTSRCLTRHGGDVLISDTVGFIRRLPDRLLASFESTLAEIVEASLLVFVVDASDHERELHLATTRQIVEKIGAGDVPRFYVFNKLDRLPAAPLEAELSRWSEGHPHAALSSGDAGAVAALEEALLRAVRGDASELSAFVPYAASEILSLVYRGCRVLSSVAADDGLSLRIQGPAPVISRVRAALEEATR